MKPINTTKLLLSICLSFSVSFAFSQSAVQADKTEVECKKTETVSFTGLQGMTGTGKTKAKAWASLAKNMAKKVGLKCVKPEKCSPKDCKMKITWGTSRPTFKKTGTHPDGTKTYAVPLNASAANASGRLTVKCYCVSKPKNACAAPGPFMVMVGVPPIVFDSVNLGTVTEAQQYWLAYIIGDNGNDYPGDVDWGCENCGTTGACPMEVDPLMSAPLPVPTLMGDEWMFDATNYLVAYGCSSCDEEEEPPLPRLTNAVEENFIEGLYPNPTSGELVAVINLPKQGVVKVEITNLLGKSMQSINFGSLIEAQHKLQLNVGDLAPAIYYFNVYVDNKLHDQQKISIVR